MTQCSDQILSSNALCSVAVTRVTGPWFCALEEVQLLCASVLVRNAIVQLLQIRLPSNLRQVVSAYPTSKVLPTK